MRAWRWMAAGGHSPGSTVSVECPHVFGSMTVTWNEPDSSRAADRPAKPPPMISTRFCSAILLQGGGQDGVRLLEGGGGGRAAAAGSGVTIASVRRSCSHM